MKNIKYIIISLIVIGLAVLAIVLFKNNNNSALENENNLSINEVVDDDSSDKKEENSLKENTEDSVEKKDVPLKDNSKGVPILYYHSVFENEKKDEVVIDPNKFREQMKYLKDNDYETLTLKQLHDYINNNEKIPEKSVVITFDDGWIDNYDNAFPILKEFKFKATIFPITDLIDSHHLYLKSEQIKEMSDYGIEFGSHTLNHDKLSELNREDRKLNLEKSKKKIEEITGKSVESIAYPFGIYDKQVIEDTKAEGYKIAFTINSGWANGKSNLLELQRVYVDGNASMDKFKERLNNPNYE